MTQSKPEHFLRREVKYRLNSEMFEILKREFAAHVVQDKFHFVCVHNIYYDNDSHEIIRRSIEKPLFKQKLRLRAYEKNGELDGHAFVEMKNKYEGSVFKRRVKIPIGAARLLADGTPLCGVIASGQIADELLFYAGAKDCRPKIYVSYNRYAYCAKAEKDLRITFDFGIFSRVERLWLCRDSADEQLLTDDDYILEIKSERPFPLWLTGILAKHRLYPQSFSKYGRIYEESLRTAANI